MISGVFYFLGCFFSGAGVNAYLFFSIPRSKISNAELRVDLR